MFSTNFDTCKRTSPDTRSPRHHTTHQHAAVFPSLVGWGTYSLDSATEPQQTEELQDACSPSTQGLPDAALCFGLGRCRDLVLCQHSGGAPVYRRFPFYPPVRPSSYPSACYHLFFCLGYGPVHGVCYCLFLVHRVVGCGLVEKGSVHVGDLGIYSLGLVGPNPFVKDARLPLMQGELRRRGKRRN